MEHIKENCPLCKRPSEFYYVDGENRKYYRYEYCTDFQLYINAEKLLVEKSNEWKTNLSEKSHVSNHQKVLFITAGFNSNDPSQYEFRVEFHDRDTVPTR